MSTDREKPAIRILPKHRKMRQALIQGDRVVTVPLIPSAARALQEWNASKAAEIDEVLAPYGVQSEQILIPTYEVVIEEPIAPPRCSAHGEEFCPSCSRSRSRQSVKHGECVQCFAFGSTGMHHDSCPERVS